MDPFGHAVFQLCVGSSFSIQRGRSSSPTLCFHPSINPSDVHSVPPLQRPQLCTPVPAQVGPLKPKPALMMEGTDRKVRGQSSRTHHPLQSHLRNRRQAVSTVYCTIQTNPLLKCSRLFGDRSKNNDYGFAGRKRLLNDAGLINSPRSLFRGRKTNL